MTVSISRAQWKQVLTADWPATPKIFAFAVNGDHIFAGFESGAFRSSDQGAAWNPVFTGFNSLTTVFSLAVKGTTLFAGTSAGLFRSSDHGGSWTRIGLTVASIQSLVVNGSHLFAGVPGGGIRKRPLVEMGVTTALRPSRASGAEFDFAPGSGSMIRSGTGIGFAIGHRAWAHIGVYDAKGSKAATLVNSVK